MKRVALSAARLALIAALSTGLGGSALAHAHLKSASPGVGAIVHAAPMAIALTFSEGVVPKFSGVELSDAAGKRVPLGAAANGGEPATLVTPITSALAPGVYTVTWHAVATDSHRTKGSFRFTLAP